MSSSTLNSLLEYLYGTLSSSNMRWVARHLVERAGQQESQQLKPYTMEELNTRIDKAEADSAAGRYRSDEEVFRDWGMGVDEEEEKVHEEVAV